MARVNSQSLAWRKEQGSGPGAGSRRSFQVNPWKNDPGLSLRAAVREDDRLDNDREVGNCALGRERHGGRINSGKNARQRGRQSGMTLT